MPERKKMNAVVAVLTALATKPEFSPVRHFLSTMAAVVLMGLAARFGLVPVPVQAPPGIPEEVQAAPTDVPAP